jgi:biopolymer transport protein TolR
MAMALGSNRLLKADINITPMIDVLLVLIIIFMVITPLAPVGLRTMLPEPAPAQLNAPRLQDIVVTVQKDGAILLNQERVDFTTLPARLHQIFQVRGDGVIFLRGDGDLEFSKIAEVIDIAKGAGLQRVALMTRP